MKLQLSLEILLRVLDYLNEAVYIVDQDGIVIYVNRAAARLEQLDQEEMIGKTVQEIYGYTELREEKNAPSLNVLKTGIPQVDENIEWFTKAGKNVNAITSSYPLLDQEDIIGVFSVSENIEELRTRLKSVPLRGKTPTVCGKSLCVTVRSISLMTSSAKARSCRRPSPYPNGLPSKKCR